MKLVIKNTVTTDFVAITKNCESSHDILTCNKMRVKRVIATNLAVTKKTYENTPATANDVMTSKSSM